MNRNLPQLDSRWSSSSPSTSSSCSSLTSLSTRHETSTQNNPEMSSSNSETSSDLDSSVQDPTPTNPSSSSTSPKPPPHPPSTTSIATTPKDITSSLNLIATSIAEQRQIASKSIIHSKAFIAAVLLSLSTVLASLEYIGVDRFSSAFTLLAILAGSLKSVEYFTAGYLEAAEKIGWDWLYGHCNGENGACSSGQGFGDCGLCEEVGGGEDTGGREDSGDIGGGEIGGGEIGGGEIRGGEIGGGEIGGGEIGGAAKDAERKSQGKGLSHQEEPDPDQEPDRPKKDSGQINPNWDNQRDIVWVTKRNESVIATMVLRVCPSASKDAKCVPVIRAWTVKRIYRRLGLGTSLLRHVVEFCRENGWEDPRFARSHVYSLRLVPAWMQGDVEWGDDIAKRVLEKELRC